MAYPLIIRPAAETYIAAAKRWYNGQRPGLGDEFVEAVETVPHRIREFPEFHAAGYREVRHTLLRRFPYVVYYRFQEN
jgi:hypothetical protein